jgi:hypothetical protein
MGMCVRDFSGDEKTQAKLLARRIVSRAISGKGDAA